MRTDARLLLTKADGCSVSASCLQCPLAVCQYEIMGGLRTAKLLTAIKPLWQQGLSNRAIGSALKRREGHISKFINRMVRDGYLTGPTLRMPGVQTGQCVPVPADQFPDLCDYLGLRVRDYQLPALAKALAQATESFTLAELQSGWRGVAVCAIRDQFVYDLYHAGLTGSEIAFVLHREPCTIYTALRRLGIAAGRLNNRAVA